MDLLHLFTRWICRPLALGVYTNTHAEKRTQRLVRTAETPAHGRGGLYIQLYTLP